MTELKNATTTPDNTGTLLRWNIPCQMSFLSDVAPTFLNSIVVLTPNYHFFYCATIAFTEPHLSYLSQELSSDKWK